MMKDKNIEFIAAHKPKLRDGNYTLTLTSKLLVKGKEDLIPEKKQSFVVTGERYSLLPSSVDSLFPESGMFGDYSEVLPHVILNRSTLPWERSANDSGIPWLALLLFDVAEQPEVKTVYWKFNKRYLINDEANEDVIVPYHFVDEIGDGDTQNTKVQVIDIPKSVLKKIMPKESDLNWLSHVRKINEEEKAVVVANRLPKSGSSSYMHMVSLEGIYPNIFTKILQDNTVPDTKKIRLLSLKHWNFNTHSKEQTFSGLLGAIGRTERRKTNVFLRGLKVWWNIYLPGNSLHKNIISMKDVDPKINKYARVLKLLKGGKLILKHTSSPQKNKVSLYGGPLLPIAYTIYPFDFPVKSSNDLLLYDPKFKILDVSYATAWELGRQLTIANKAVAVALFKWKKLYSQKIHAIMENDGKRLDGVIEKSSDDWESILKSVVYDKNFSVDLPENLRQWLYDLSLLTHVPFNYLVFGSDIVTEESISYFRLDKDWLRCLVHGAFSLGSSVLYEHQRDKSMIKKTDIGKLLNIDHIGELAGGFVIRSSVFSQWKHVDIELFDEASNRLEIIKSEQVSNDILICIFNTTKLNKTNRLKTLRFSVKTKALPFDLPTNTIGNTSLSFKKALKNMTTGVIDETKTIDITNTNGLISNERVLSAHKIGEAIKNKLGLAAGDFTSGQFAFQMVGGEEKVEITLE